jgi:hypothetical protein
MDICCCSGLWLQSLIDVRTGSDPERVIFGLVGGMVRS